MVAEIREGKGMYAIKRDLESRTDRIWGCKGEGEGRIQHDT